MTHLKSVRRHYFCQLFHFYRALPLNGPHAFSSYGSIATISLHSWHDKYHIKSDVFGPYALKVPQLSKIFLYMLYMPIALLDGV